RELHQRSITRVCANNRDYSLNQRECECQHQSVVPQFRNHFSELPALFASPSCHRPLFFNASTTSLGIYRSSCLARTVSAANIPPFSSLPSTPTPGPSRNKSGTIP